VLGALLAWPAAVAAQDETAFRLADGKGRERVQAACALCHSRDYIVMNSPYGR
jgi:hypothetical protein